MHSSCAAMVTLGHFSFTSTKHHFIRSLFKECHTFVDTVQAFWDKAHFHHVSKWELPYSGMDVFLKSILRAL